MCCMNNVCKYLTSHQRIIRRNLYHIYRGVFLFYCEKGPKVWLPQEHDLVKV